MCNSEVCEPQIIHISTISCNRANIALFKDSLSAFNSQKQFLKHWSLGVTNSMLAAQYPSHGQYFFIIPVHSE
jgi:hypothetical protein